MTAVKPKTAECELAAMTAAIDELPSIPETLIEILRLIDDPDSGAADLARVVRVDAPLAAKIIRLANSPYYGGRERIGDISRCIAVIGYRTMRSVAICLTVATNLMTAVANGGGRLDYRALWRHSVAVGALAKQLARMAGDEDPEEMFSAGLLHDLGKFVLELHSPETYDRVVYTRSRSGGRLVDAEREAFGFDHAQAGEAFARVWRFPETLAASFGRHHREPLAAGAGAVRVDRVVAIVALADYLANTMEPSRSDLGFDPAQCDAQRLHEAAGLTVAQVEAELPAMREAVRLAAVFVNLTDV
ncbi:MAG: HDOD domain-containing protein [Krumholzibacteria bacterium]|nr:HDOD domain-containing protein [Candidatus Krumholzibacteria bacterium]